MEEKEELSALMQEINSDPELAAIWKELSEEKSDLGQLNAQRAEQANIFNENYKKPTPALEELLNLTDQEKETYSQIFNKLTPQKQFVFITLANDLWVLQSRCLLNYTNHKLLTTLLKHSAITTDQVKHLQALNKIMETTTQSVATLTLSRINNTVKTALSDKNIGITRNNLKIYISFLKGVLKKRTKKQAQAEEIPLAIFLSDYINAIQKGIDEYTQQLSLPALVTRIPEDRVMPNTKLSNTMVQEQNLFDDFFELKVIDKDKNNKKSQPVYTAVRLKYDSKDIEIIGGQSTFTPFDMVVHDTVGSIFASGQNTFTPETVYRVMTCKTGNKYVDPKTIAEVESSIEKSLRLRATIDITKEAEARGYTFSNNPNYKKGDRIIMEDTLLSAKKLQVRTGGTIKTGYIFNTIPILYDYAEKSNQIIRVKTEYLNLSKQMNVTNEVVVIRDFILKQIEYMRGGRKGWRNNKITYQSIYDLLLITPEQFKNIKQKHKKTRDTTISILKALITNGYIKAFNQYNKGKEIAGVEIDY